MILLAVPDGHPAGTLELLIVEGITRGGRPWAQVENVVVDTAHRRRGIGAALMEAALGIAREAGCAKVQLVSNERRGPAHAMYRAAGFSAPVVGFRRYL